MLEPIPNGPLDVFNKKKTGRTLADITESLSLANNLRNKYMAQLETDPNNEECKLNIEKLDNEEEELRYIAYRAGYVQIA